MTSPTTLFPMLPDGFTYVPDFITDQEEHGLLARAGDLEFGQVTMRGVVARRRVRQYGWHYRFDTYQLTQGPPIPEFLFPLQARAGLLAGVAAAELSEALFTEYPPGATIGWHRDAPMFGVVVGISLGSACRFRLRPRVPPGTDHPREKPLTVVLAPRSAYVLDGAARRGWEHSIPAVEELRYSITFRTRIRKG
jgi:alkylated DNA repair dioxygenase AlkB